ncbi:MarR family winged helix-turn-helix transcriptional regulator [Ramlibacter rhizophilus]|nr:MarR family winged helix-turn-helix transcriptional regulator [Ramlibacter rhizophilus]
MADPSPDPLSLLDRDGPLPFDAFVTFRINQLSMAFERQWTRYMRDTVGLSLGEWRVVATLAASGSATFTHVAQATGMNKSLCSRCVASLETQGLVEPSPTPGDSRSVTLALTRKAQRLVAQLRPVVLRRQQLLLEALTREERVALYAAIDKLRAAAARWDAPDGAQSL